MAERLFFLCHSQFAAVLLLFLPALLLGDEGNELPPKLPKLWMKPPRGNDRTVLSPNGKVIAVYDASAGILALYDRENREELRTIDCATYFLGFTADSKRLVSLHLVKPKNDKARWQVSLWSVQTGKRLSQFELHPRHGERNPLRDRPRLLYAISEGQLIVAGVDRVITSYDLKNGKEIGTFQAKEHRPKMMALSGDGKWLLTAGEKNELRVFDVAKRQLVNKVYDHNDEEVCALAISKDGKWCASLAGRHLRRLWVFDRAKESEKARTSLLMICHGEMLWFSPDAKTLYATGDGAHHGLNVWDWQKSKEIRGGYPKRRYPSLAVLIYETKKWNRALIRESSMADDGTLLTRGEKNDLRLWFAPPRKQPNLPADPEPPPKLKPRK